MHCIHARCTCIPANLLLVFKFSAENIPKCEGTIATENEHEGNVLCVLTVGCNVLKRNIWKQQKSPNYSCQDSKCRMTSLTLLHAGCRAFFSCKFCIGLSRVLNCSLTIFRPILMSYTFHCAAIKMIIVIITLKKCLRIFCGEIKEYEFFLKNLSLKSLCFSI